MTKRFDCVVCGELCVDLPIGRLDLERPLADVTMLPVDPIRPGGGGIVANSGIAMSRLGLTTAAMSCLGDDAFGELLGELLTREGIDTTHLIRLPKASTSATAVLVGEGGEHTFAFHAGASRQLTREAIRDHMAVFQQSHYALFGYYGLMPQLEESLPDILQHVRAAGCRTAMDAAGGGGSLRPLDRILPHLDVYVPSHEEAISQTGHHDAKDIIQAFRQFAPEGLLGVKLGADGALLSPGKNEWIHIDAVEPPGPVVDTTGAGDCLYAGLIAGLVGGLSVEEAGKFGAAAGACSVTEIGAVAGIRDVTAIRRLAGLA